MDTFTAIEARRAVKHYDPSHEMTEQEIHKILHAAIQAPTSFNIQHWRFLVIKDPALRKQIRTLGFDQAQFTDASLLVLLTGDMQAWSRDPTRYWANAPEDVAKILVGMIEPFHNGNEQLQRDEAQRSIGMAAQTIMLAAKAMGYDSCPMIGFDLEAVSKLVNLPADHCIGPFIAIGKKTQDPWPKPGQLPLADVVMTDRFPG